MKQLYPKYFQKSFTFLYPLLGFAKNKELQPVQVFISWKDRILPEDRRLICVYQQNPNNKVWMDFESNKLLPHSMLDFCEKLASDKIVYVFDMNSIAEDIDAFLKGKYSVMSEFAKEKIAHYYGVSSPEFEYIESFNYPEKYHKVYSEILNVELSIIQESHELCDPFHPERETLQFKPEQFSI